jgi:hypothetical protein
MFVMAELPLADVTSGPTELSPSAFCSLAFFFIGLMISTQSSLSDRNKAGAERGLGVKACCYSFIIAQVSKGKACNGCASPLNPLVSGRSS